MGRISEICIRVNDNSRHISYYFPKVNRKFSIVLGDSGSGKTDFFNIVRYIQNNPKDKNYEVIIGPTSISALSGYTKQTDNYKLNVLENKDDYKYIISNSKDTIFIIDDMSNIPNNMDFRDAILESSNYAIIMRRKRLLPYQLSIDALFELKENNKVISAVNKYNVPNKIIRSDFDKKIV